MTTCLGCGSLFTQTMANRGFFCQGCIRSDDVFVHACTLEGYDVPVSFIRTESESRRAQK